MIKRKGKKKMFESETRGNEIEMQLWSSSDYNEKGFKEIIGSEDIESFSPGILK